MSTVQIVFVVLIVASSIVLIPSVLLQESHRPGASGAITGGSQHAFSKKKARGMQALLEKATIMSAVVFMVCVFVFGFLE